MTERDDPAGGHLEERVAILAPTGRDAEMVCAALRRAGLHCRTCADMEVLCAALAEGAGTLFVAEEALSGEAVATLAGALGAQPPWSDVPIVLATGGRTSATARAHVLAALVPAGNLFIVERPGHVLTLVAAVQAALRARRRQYQVRALLAEQVAQVERLHSERELRARFVSMLAHDLRGPLTAALISAQRLIAHPGRLDDRPDLAAKIERSLQRIEAMVRDLLDTSRIQAGQPLPLRLEECELASLAREVAEELNSVHGERVRVEARGELRGVWSAAELRRALWNLASNAIKYGNPEAPVTIAVRRDGERALASVHNRGPTLSAEEQRRVFEPFARAGSAETRSTLGWGLGLTLVRGCAEAHGGQVHVTSDAEHGTTFTLELPLDARPAQAG